jgi:iron complex transport system substrate-binding protein
VKPLAAIWLLCWALTNASLTMAELQTSAAVSKPQRIVSLSLCIDQVLLMLVDKSRIAAVTHLAPDPAYSYQWQAAQSLPLHNGLAEEIVPLQPDLVIGVQYTDIYASQLMQRLGLTVNSLKAPNNLAEAEAFIRAIGQQVGESERADQLIHSMHRDIDKAKALVSQLPKQLALSYGPNGFTAGNNTLKGEILNAAGYRNLAAELGISDYGNISLEQLIWSQPDVIILDQDDGDQNSQAQTFTNHPVLHKLLATQQLHYLPTNHWLCPGPSASKAILALAEQRL